ncbi:MAG: type II toxin-antitoxin system RelE/ParE family toxin [Taibaiella sp.]|jgi:plasmid stabilization system protein ParE
MSYKIKLMPLAALEIIEAYDWYEEQRENLGTDFLNELDNFYESLHTNPLTYSFYDEHVRNGKINRFPYSVVYEIIEHSIVIYSVFMSKQDPVKKRKK